MYAVYRRQRVRRLIAAHQPEVVLHEYSGVRLKVRLADPLATAWYDRDWPVSTEIRYLREQGILEGALVFDLGAHHAVKASVLAAGGANVVAVEALPHNVRAAEENLALNPDVGRRVIVVNAAVTKTSGPTKVAFELNSRLDEWGSVTVPGATIDELSSRFGWPDLVYMDIEGGEVDALAGAPRTILNRRWWLIEVHGDEQGLRAALADYRLHRLEDDQVFLVAEPP